jgi:hypothetical protein
MKDYIKKVDGKYRYYSVAGLYEADSMFGLLFEIFRHRLWHFIHQGDWKD